MALGDLTLCKADLSESEDEIEGVGVCRKVSLNSGHTRAVRLAKYVASVGWPTSDDAIERKNRCASLDELNITTIPPYSVTQVPDYS